MKESKSYLKISLLVLLLVAVIIPLKMFSKTHAFIPNKDFTLTAEQLVNRINKSDARVLNAQKKGTVYTFTNGEESFGIDSGIVLDTSGEVEAENDADLAELAEYEYGGHTASLEFTAIANGNLLNFNYVFASSEFNEEYAKYNDIFAIFVSVNGEDYENIATLSYDDVKVPVTIQNLKETGLYDNRIVDIGDSPKINGVSNVFNAQKAVLSGDIVKVKFVIADITDTESNSYILIESDSLSFDVPEAEIDYVNESLTKLDSSKAYVIKVGNNEYNVTTDESGSVALIGYDDKGIEYNFIGKSLYIHKIKDNGDVAASYQLLDVPSRRKAPSDIEPMKDMLNEDGKNLITTENDITINNASSQVEYSLDKLTWVSPSGESVVFNNLEPNTTYTIYTRYPAEEGAFNSNVSKGTNVITYRMFNVSEYNVQNYTGEYDGNEHSAFVTADDGVEIKYSKTLNGTYTNNEIKFKDACNETVYYSLTKEGYHTGYGVLFVDIEKANITVKANDYTKEYGTADEVIGYTVTGTDEDIKFNAIREKGENVGSYVISVTSKEELKNYAVNYETGTYEITPKPINDVRIDETEYYYTSLNIEPEVKVYDNGTLVDAKEYVVKYKNNINIGKGTIDVVAKEGSNYAVSGSLEFDIIAHELSIFNSTDSTLNYGAGKIESDLDKIASAVEFTDAEIDKMKAGKSAAIYLEVVDLSENQIPEDKSLIVNVLNGNALVGKYMSINLYKKIGNGDATQVSDTKEKLKLSVALPEELNNTNTNVNREFFIVRVHDNEATILDAQLVDNTLVFETDKFSTYAIAYKDVEKEKPASENDTKKPVEETKNPTTGDYIVRYYVAAIVSVMLLVLVGLYYTNEDKDVQ